MTRQERIWLAALAFVTLVLQLWLTQFFTFGQSVAFSGDWNLGNVDRLAQSFPPTAFYERAYWLGMPVAPNTPTPEGWWALLSPWVFLTTWYPLCGVVALVGFQRFLRGLGLSVGSSLVGAVMYAWQGQLLSNLCPGHVAPGLIFAAMPWASWAARRAILEKKWVWALWGGIFTGWMVAVLADRGALASLIVGIVGLGTWVESWGAGNRLRRLWILLLLVGVAFAVAYPSLRSTLNFAIGESVVEQKTRAEQYDWATQWSFPPEEVLTFLVPGFFGWRTGATEGAYWGRVGQSPGWPKDGNMMNYHLESTTLGTVSAVLFLVAVLAFFRTSLLQTVGGEGGATRTKGWLAVFLLGFFLFLLLGFGRFLAFHHWFYELPFMDQWRNPNKFLTPGTFCFAVLASYGAALIEAALSGMETAQLQKILNRIVWGIGLGLAVVGAIVLKAGWLLSGVLISQGMPLATADSSIGTTGACTILALVLVLVLHGILGLFFKHEREASRTLPNPWIQKFWNHLMQPGRVGFSLCLFLAFITLAQMVWVHRHFLQATPALPPKNDALLEPLQPGAGKERIALVPGDPFLQHYLTLEFPRAGISSIDITAASRQPADYRRFFGAFKEDRKRMWQMSGVRWLAGSKEGWERNKGKFTPDEIKEVRWMHIEGNRLGALRFAKEPNEKDASHVLVELTQWQPKALVYFNAWKAPTPEQVMPLVVDPTFNPATTVVLEKLGLPPLTEPGRVAVDLQRYTNREVRAAVAASAPCVLVINDRYDSDWKATLNGKPIQLEPANGIYCALRLPAGASQVVLQYQPETGPTWMVWGLYAVVVLVSLACVLRRTEPSA